MIQTCNSLKPCNLLFHLKKIAWTKNCGTKVNENIVLSPKALFGPDTVFLPLSAEKHQRLWSIHYIFYRQTFKCLYTSAILWNKHNSSRMIILWVTAQYLFKGGQIQTNVSSFFLEIAAMFITIGKNKLFYLKEQSILHTEHILTFLAWILGPQQDSKY